MLEQVQKQARILMIRQVKWLVRRLFALRKPLFSRSGFVLPTATLLLVMFTLVVSSLLFRSSERTMQVAEERQQQVISNAATPAIDRAKAKLEYLFQQDPRLPGGLPSDDLLESIILNDETHGVPVLDDDPILAGNQNPYLLPDETPLDLNNDGTPDSAWSFEVDTDGDGEVETVAYSILSRTVSDDGNFSRINSDEKKAPELVVRNAPINLIRSSEPECADISRAPEAGWDPISSATVRRAFQVTALVVDGDNNANRTVATLEMQQDRQADKGNKWGAWMRNDLEVFPGPGFNWNGAMHTEGNLIIGDGNNFQAYLISSPASCLYTRENSEITIGGNSDGTTPPFLGQMINGSMKNNNYRGGSAIDIFGYNGASQTFNLNSSKDSVSASVNPADMSLDPVVLFTTNQSQARSGDPNNAGVRDDGWKERDIVKERRIFNRSARAPYVDDTYRADNRYGPKAAYSDLIELDGNQVGEAITAADPNQTTLLNSNPAQVDALGLDGYWERRAWAEGLRVIVGQRLELGNAYGWQGNTDPLYPPEGNAANGTTMADRAHELKQWKSLRDNLAAVQSTAVYHSAADNRNFPLACLATTAHPGTPETLTNSTTFKKVFPGTTNPNTDFLTGNGTNGWEFNPPATSETAFINAIDDDEPLRIALENLAHFAGDGAHDGSSDFTRANKHFGHYGAFPPLQDSRVGGSSNNAVPSAGPQIHPYPYLSMWGDFSDLRRVIQLLNRGTGSITQRYNRLSLADQTTLQTASCTLGMLAYNLDNLQSYSATGTQLGNLGNALDAPSLKSLINASPERYIAELPTTFQETARLLHLQEQVQRDRRFGFADVPNGTPGYTYKPKNTFSYGGKTYNAGQTYTFGCDFSNSYFGYPKADYDNAFANPIVAALVGNDLEKRLLRLATSFCPTQPKFPSLYYLFPVANHDHEGTATAQALGADPNATKVQPGSEPYVDQDYIFNTGQTDEVNHGYTYTVLQDDNSNGIEDDTPAEDGINAIAIQPRARANWQLPNTTTTSGRVNTIADNTGATNQTVATAFLDKGIFNGREMMSVRVLDFDLDMLRDSTAFGGVGDQSWLPDSGIVYAFREDAVREDEIARPRATAWGSCDTATEITSSTCRMNAVSNAPQDPPVNSTTGISPKPVDFYADPDRRPHGFRLRNGVYLRQKPEPPAEFALRGMALISDNPVYIQADNCAFNLHSTSENSNISCNNTNSNRIEEFNTTLNDNWNNFYSRGAGGNDLNENFAREEDTWRPAEIISDAISILSDDFVDGSIVEGIRRQNVGGNSSYRTLNAPNNQDRSWIREDGSDSNEVNRPSPVVISRNGFPRYMQGGSNLRYGKDDTRTYMNFTNGKSRIDVNANNNSRVNAVIVSGLIPSRAQQSYGGFHNFPRFIEDWGGEALNIAGAFVQLNFSSYATAPFDQDSWEPGNSAQANELIPYYGAPNRRWGYDVGLQYSPAGPVAQRFVTPSNTRSEFYRELPLDDPYVLNLRCAQVSGDRIDPDVDVSSCPS